MELRHLIAVEKVTLALAALVMAGGLVLCERQVAFSLALGAGIMGLNAYALRRIGQRAFRKAQAQGTTAGGPPARPGAALLLFNLKMGLLIAVIWAVLRLLPVHPIGFLVGISIFPVAIVLVALRHGLSESDPGPAPAPRDEDTHG